MTPSIRTFLLINLLLSVTLITSLAIVGNLVLSHKDIQKQLDTQLVHTAVSMRALLSLHLTPADIETIQKNLLTDRQREQNMPIVPNRIPLSNAAEENSFFIEFQVWGPDNQLIIRSPGAPLTPFTNGVIGLSSVNLKNQDWRVYTVKAQANQIVMIAEHANYRQALENRLTQDSIFIMLLSYPFLGVLIWFIVGRALQILKKVTREVSHRAPSYLQPFDLTSVPSEIIPLIEALNNLFGRLQDAFEREKRFTADAAHELKTPLAAISAQAQVALRTNDDQSRRQALSKILAGIHRSTHVIQQLLTLSRMVPEATIKEAVPIRLSREVADIAAMLAPEAINKNIEIEFLTPDSTACISGNATALGILIRNLIDNAIRYTPKGGWIKISIEENPKQVILIVQDNGPGIPQELRERVFERFYRIVGNESPGSGLGLGIVLQIAKLHSAEILLLTPESGAGLEVRVLFPKAK